jgi:hypothetical protein
LKTITSQEENKTFTGDYRCQENQIKMLKLSTDAYTILAEDQIIYHVIGKFVVNKQHPNYLVIPIEIGIGKIIDIMEIGGAARFFHGTITRTRRLNHLMENGHDYERRVSNFKKCVNLISKFLPLETLMRSQVLKILIYFTQTRKMIKVSILFRH